jgi:transmembrane sensor
MKQRPPANELRPAATASETAAGKNALAWAVEAGKSDELMRRVEVSLRRTRRRRVSVALTCVVGLFAIAGVARLRLKETASPALASTPSSAVVSHPAKRTLADGSIVELNDGADIAVEFSAEVRRVVLKNGEAHFDVAKETARPFVVVARGVEVRAVGTAFAVQLGSAAVEVVVTHGTVAVERSLETPEAAAAIAKTSPTSQPAPLALVAAGKRIVIESAPAAGASTPAAVEISETEMSQRLAWRVPRLEFSGTRLAEAIAMFNQHNRVKLTLDPALGHLQMSGVLRADNIDSLLRLLKTEFDIEPENRSDTEIVLRRR